MGEASPALDPDIYNVSKKNYSTFIAQIASDLEIDAD